MAAPMRVTRLRPLLQGQLFNIVKNRANIQLKPAAPFKHNTRSLNTKNIFRGTEKIHGSYKVLLGSVCAVTVGALTYSVYVNKHPVYAASKSRPEPRISQSIRIQTDTTGLKLTLYQYTSCPFCCKVRAVLDYYGLSYDIVEVNSVFKTQLKWSDYKKVPVLVVDNASEDSFLQINDSTVIISLLRSHLIDISVPIEKLNTYYPGFYGKNEKGKMTWDFPNRYFLMFGDSIADGRTEKQRSSETKSLSEERKWRQWTDDHFVHMISPNVYRTPSEALQAFRYFSEVGRWEENFSTPSRLFVIYTGAAVMFLLGKLLKRKYKLDNDVRLSLYGACNDWLMEIGNGNKFHGGDQPSLADLSVYGVLTSIEGCDAFKELLDKTKIGGWYGRMKREVGNNGGSQYIK